MYILLLGYPPFYGINEEEIFKKTWYYYIYIYLNSQGNYPIYNQDWDLLSDSAKDLLSQILVVETWKRITTGGILKHRWIKTPPNNTMCETQNRMNRYLSRRQRAQTSVSPRNISRNISHNTGNILSVEDIKNIRTSEGTPKNRPPLMELKSL